MTDRNGGKEPDAEMRARLAKLSQELDTRASADRQVQAKAAQQGPGSIGSAMSMGFRVMSEFVAAVVVSALVGWQADRWLGTSPGLLILFVALGTAAGFWTVYRTATRPTGLPGKQ